MTITICVTSDLHGRMDRLLQIKNELKQYEPDVIIDNGDFLQGSYTSYYYDFIDPQPHPMLQIANDIGYDCAIFGNHEFNYPLKHVEIMRKQCQFPWLAGNIGSFAKPYFIKNVREKRIAVVGVTTHFTPLWDEQQYTKSLTFTDALEAACYWVDYVYKNEQTDYIILSYHGGFTNDVDSGWQFAKNNGENQANDMLQIPHIDALITGHQHLQIASVVNGIPVIQPGANGSCFGIITLGAKASAKCIPIDPVPEQYPPEVENWLNEKIGHSQTDLTYEGLLASRIEKPMFVDFLHDVKATATGAEVSVVELMFHERGGFTGDITNFDVLKNISRSNTVKVLALSGAVMLEAMEQSAAVFAIDAEGHIDFSYNVITDEPQPYLYTYWCGLSYTIDVNKPVGQRIQNVFINDKPFMKELTYRVAINSYLATGVDFPSFLHSECLYETEAILPALIMQHIQQHSVRHKNTGTITVTK